MSECSRLTAAAIDAYSCDKVEASGSGTKVYLINLEDISEYTEADGVVSGITLKSGTTGCLFTSASKSTEGTSSLNAGTYISTHTHQALLRLFVRSKEAKAFLDSLANSRVVAIIENQTWGFDDETKYEIYGLNSGLKASAIDYSTTVTDGVVASATLASDDTSKEATLPKTFYVTSKEATETALAALVTTTAA